ncbi:MAG: phosphomethylpyrimidine synthase ThiC [Acidaminococcus sp.]|nr:phosphomethylpyrimidine synthase ThiC [Acidaminococcus sp.]MCI2100084.1 phosphomethylpyrimidine synthase ThiC [Acidaminococcus sp.]MCI2114361.1 phosphomethylpyrimidine synthase ThiC [Acidaminococcus sp.]MCI2116334.1 phosphomethylpyrimidine synthase ThiC [Acidaminococcus sp.]
MQTQRQAALDGKITDAMAEVARQENLDPEVIRERVAKGTVAICANINHTNLVPRGVGEGLSTKVNANIGTSSAFPDPEPELKKLKAAIDAGADAVMDLSTGNNIDASRRAIIKNSTVMVGTVPIYQATVAAIKAHGKVTDMTKDDIFQVIEEQAKDGADFMTMHCGITRQALKTLIDEGREMDIVSRGGSFLSGWMLANGKENPFYEYFDEILDICARYDVTISLGDGCRPGCLADATDRTQITELINLGSLTQRAWKRGVQVMVEGPGHVPYNQIATNMQLEKRLCHGAPFYVLGPLVTDIAPGYDHITSAIGGTLAAVNGADFLCYVTPAEHLGLPDINDVREGVIAARIAGHAADVAKGLPSAVAQDLAMARARKKLDWDAQLKLAIDPVKATEFRKAKNKSTDEYCSMCGDYCAVRIISEYLDKVKEEKKKQK